MPLRRSCLPLAVLMMATGAWADSTPDYERDIKPIFKEHCGSCHSQLKQKGGLRLDAGALIHKGGKHGPALATGGSDKSLIMQRLLSADPEERMPNEGKPLPTEKIDLLRRWIDSGAAFPKDEVVPR